MMWYSCGDYKWIVSDFLWDCKIICLYEYGDWFSVYDLIIVARKLGERKLVHKLTRHTKGRTNSKLHFCNQQQRLNKAITWHDSLSNLLKYTNNGNRGWVVSNTHIKNDMILLWWLYCKRLYNDFWLSAGVQN